MRDTTRFRRLASAAGLVAGAGLILAGVVVAPWNNSDTAAENLAIAGDHAGATLVSDILFFLGILTLIPGVLAVMRLLRGRAPILGLAGGCAMIAGLVGAMLLVVSDGVMVLLAEPAADRAVIAAALDGSEAWGLTVVLIVFIAGLNLGQIVLGAGVLRARIVPVWAGILFVAGPVLGVAAHAADMKVLDVAGTAAFLLAVAPIARLISAVPDEDWDRAVVPVPVAARPEPVPA